VRRDPMAMLPFIGYNAGDYFNHWITVGKDHDAAKLPRIYYVNWFRKGEDGRFLWPGYGENSRVLAWIARRCEGEAQARESEIGLLPPTEGPGGIDTSDLDVEPAALQQLLSVDREGWCAQLPQVRAHFAKFGERLPAELHDQLGELERRLQR